MYIYAWHRSLYRFSLFSEPDSPLFLIRVHLQWYSGAPVWFEDQNQCMTPNHHQVIMNQG